MSDIWDDGAFLSALQLGKIASTLKTATSKKEKPLVRDLYTGIMFVNVYDFMHWCFENYGYKQDEIVTQNAALQHVTLWKSDYTSSWNWQGVPLEGYSSNLELQTNKEMAKNTAKYCPNRDEDTRCYYFVFDQNQFINKDRFEINYELFLHIIQGYTEYCKQNNIYFSCFLEKDEGFERLTATDGNQQAAQQEKEIELDVIDEIEEKFEIYCNIKKLNEFFESCDINLELTDNENDIWTYTSFEDKNDEGTYLNRNDLILDRIEKYDMDFKKFPASWSKPKHKEQIWACRITLKQFSFNKHIKLKKDMLKNFLLTCLLHFAQSNRFFLFDNYYLYNSKKPVGYCSLLLKNNKPILLPEKEELKLFE